ncbi:MAG: hypothetical protein HYY93_14870 [Planctomycetes bacterium]|nr:hypothetical protein [Planctomycetota bacterium]
MRFLFRAFERHRVRYLVISGQACVLYGAAQFTQDLDLWVEPTPANLRRLLAALGALRARVHKLTPPLSVANMKRGHGFHFLLPTRGSSPLYLDLMGQPPRVGTFAKATLDARRLSTPWGRLPVVSIDQLVEIKKTNRPADYEVITRLALIRLGHDPSPSAARLRWAVMNIFRVEDLWEMVQRWGGRMGPRVFAGASEAARLHQVWRAGRSPGLRELSLSAARLASEALRLQDRGRRYWHPRLAELRRWRRSGLLLPEGSLVSEWSS